MSDPFRPDALVGAPLMAAQQAERPKLETPEATEAMKKAAAEFESMMLSEMLGPMFNALDTNGFGGGGSGEAMFRPMLVENYAKGLQANGGIGIAQSVLSELMKMQTIAAPES